MRPQKIIITSLPKIPWLYLPIYFWADEIIILDPSLFEGIDKTLDIKKFCQRLSIFNLDKKIKHHSKFEHQELFWKANISASKLMKSRLRKIGNKKNLAFYFVSFLSHRGLGLASKSIFLDLVSLKLKEETGARIILDSNYFFPKHIFPSLDIVSGVIFFIFFPVILLLAISRIVFLKTRIVFKKTTTFRGGIAVDLMSGINLNESQINLPGNLSDSFLVSADRKFSIKQHLFFDYGWFNKDIIAKSDDIASSGSKIFGIRSFKPKVEFKVILALILKNYVYFLKIIVNNLLNFKFSSQLIFLKFLSILFEVQICFSQAKPSVYFSRMDYSPHHHVIGLVCNDLGIHFAGVCHSPGGGNGMINQISLLSFDTYYIHHSIFANNFYPTWKNGVSELVPIGVWRSDFIYQSRKLDFSIEPLSVRKHLQNRFTVALHLPVPQSYWYDKTVVTDVMNIYSKLILQNEDIAFILFPRRLHEAPEYFINKLNRMLIPRRCEVAQNLKPNRSQSYSWFQEIDMVVACNYSDTIFEALSSKVPAISLTFQGKKISDLYRFDSSLCVFNLEQLNSKVNSAKDGFWPSSEQWRNINDNLVGEADGRCISRIKSNLSSLIEMKEIIEG